MSLALNVELNVSLTLTDISNHWGGTSPNNKYFGAVAIGSKVVFVPFGVDYVGVFNVESGNFYRSAQTTGAPQGYKFAFAAAFQDRRGSISGAHLLAWCRARDIRAAPASGLALSTPWGLGRGMSLGCSGHAWHGTTLKAITSVLKMTSAPKWMNQQT